MVVAHPARGSRPASCCGKEGGPPHPGAILRRGLPRSAGSTVICTTISFRIVVEVSVRLRKESKFAHLIMSGAHRRRRRRRNNVVTIDVLLLLLVTLLHG